MKYLLLALLFLPLYSTTQAQALTPQEATVFAEKLYEVNILSEKGKARLQQDIRENNFERFKMPDPLNGSRGVSTKLSVAQLLQFLSLAFGSEFSYRSGQVQQSKVLRRQLKKNGMKLLSEAKYAKMEQTLQKKLKHDKGYQLEAAIQTEETFPEDWAISLPPLGMPHLNGYGYIHKTRSAMGKHCTKTLNDLLTIGLIDSTLHQEVLRLMYQQKLILEPLVLNAAAERAAYYEDFEENKAKEISFLQNLNRQGIMADDKLAKLLASYKPKEIKEKYEYLAYCNKARIFNLKEYAADPAIGYKAIFESIKTIVPDFHYQDFRFTTALDTTFADNDLTQVNATIQFTADGSTYTNTFFYDFIETFPARTATGDTFLKIADNFHNGINKLLADRNSPYRLYFANKTEAENIYGVSEFGLILLTEEQFKAWGTDMSYFLFWQSHDNTFNTANIREIIRQYEAIGLFSHLTKTEIESAKACVESSSIGSYGSMLFCFPKTVIALDWESGNLENPYEALIHQVAAASRGNFNPTNITDTFKNSSKAKTAKLSFELNGKTYETQLKMNSDWLDPKFLELIIQALQEQNIDGNLYECLEDGQFTGYLFLTQKQYAYLSQHQPALFAE